MHTSNDNEEKREMANAKTTANIEEQKQDQ
jgi:hypothetical protein